jgi:hypothetical protein
MEKITNHELLQLVNQSNERCVSLYMPVYNGVESRQNPTRLKKLLRLAEDELLRHGAKRAAATELLAPADDLLEHLTLSKESSESLAVFTGNGNCSVYSVPTTCDEVCVVGSHHYILPAVTALADNAAFYVLAVSQNQIRLLRGTKDEVHEVEVPNLPPNMQRALNLDNRQSALQAYQARPGLRKKEGLVFHGHGGEPDAAKAELLNYSREIEKAIWPVLRNESDPLVFAGVDYLFPIFRDVTQYPHVLPTPLAGNPELLSPADLRERAWKLVQPTLDRRRAAVLAKYGNCISQGRASNAIDDILIAASAGAVETLFVDPAEKRWGIFDPAEPTVRIDESLNHDGEDLINLAAVIVLRNRGMVMPMPSGNVPGGGALAAIMRYPFPPPIEQMSTASQTQRLR